MKLKKRKLIPSTELMKFKGNKMQHEFYWHDRVRLDHPATGIMSLDFRRVHQCPEAIEIDFVYVDCVKKYPVEYVTTEEVDKPFTPNYIEIPFDTGGKSRLLWKVVFRSKSKEKEVHMRFSLH